MEKITARVFAHPSTVITAIQHSKTICGGNPVTIFRPALTANSSSTATADPNAPSRLQLPSSAQRQRLAQSCRWESCFLLPRNRMEFYVPTGERMTFCAHAAMGGAWLMGQQLKADDVNFSTSLQDSDDDDDDVANWNATMDFQKSTVSLLMSTTYSCTPVPHPPTLLRILRNVFGLQGSDLASAATSHSHHRYPTLVNVSLAERPKTLVFLNPQQLQQLSAPRHATEFEQACQALESTGIYAYAVLEEDAVDVDHPDRYHYYYQARQFPKASGYAEDPATGIAAGALAVALVQQRCIPPATAITVCIDQGMTMQMPSRIEIQDIRVSNENDNNNNNNKNRVSLRVVGRVDIDEREEIELPEE